MTAHAARTPSSPVQVALADLVRLRPAGESLRLTAPRIRVAIEGGHVSPYKGRGVEFDESRPYQPGDDLRTMDWRVTARTGKPHTKVFREERNRPVFVWLDLRRPMLFATRGAFKACAPRKSAALVAWSAVAQRRPSRRPRVLRDRASRAAARARRASGAAAACRRLHAVVLAAAGDGRDARDRCGASAAAAHARRAPRQPDLPRQRLPPARRGLRAAS